MSKIGRIVQDFLSLVSFVSLITTISICAFFTSLMRSFSFCDIAIFINRFFSFGLSDLFRGLLMAFWTLWEDQSFDLGVSFSSTGCLFQCQCRWIIWFFRLRGQFLSPWTVIYALPYWFIHPWLLSSTWRLLIPEVGRSHRTSESAPERQTTTSR